MQLLVSLVYPLLSPLGIVFGFLILAVSLRRFSPKLSRALYLVAVALLLLFSSKMLGQWSYEQLEAQYPAVPVAQQPLADYIVLLGGGIGQPVPPRVAIEFRHMGDRILHAARLFHAGKAPQILVTGGHADPNRGILSEAEYANQLLLELGVPAEAIVLETESKNTSENARFSAELVGTAADTRILLVTSALHMGRAQYAFSQAKFQVSAAPTDFHIPQQKGSLWSRVVPSSTGLALFSNAFHEWLSSFVYQKMHYR